MDLSRLRVLVVHEWLLNWAGAERQLGEIMQVVPQADLIVGVTSDAMRRDHHVARIARETWLSRMPSATTNHRRLIPLQFMAFRGIDTRGYDLVISSTTGFAKAVRPQRGRPHVSYCYSPPRYIWDMQSAYESHESSATAVALRLGAPVLRAMDRASAAGVTHFIGISRFVAERIGRAYGREAAVIYPAVSAKPVGSPAPARGDFLLVLGRLVAYKRVDLAMDAAERLEIPLVVAGDGPERARLERRAGKWTRVLGPVDEAKAGELLSTCRAFVFCAEEDFGIAPIEANAHGAPVVGLARGALRETMTAETAVFFDRPEVDSLERAVRDALGRDWNPDSLTSNAKRFAPERFRQELAAHLSAAVSR